VISCDLDRAAHRATSKGTPMRPPDALSGWDEQSNAELYDRFTRAFPFYAQTSRT
jgi:hypothetical protein